MFIYSFGHPVSFWGLSCDFRIFHISGSLPLPTRQSPLQLTGITEDFQLLTTDVRERIDQKLEESTKEMDKYTNNLGRVITKLESTAKHTANRLNDTIGATPAHNGTKTYTQTLVSPPPHTNLRLAAREEIRARQFMLEGVTGESKFGDMNNTQLKSEFERILREAGIEGKAIRMVTKQRLGGILIETENDRIAAWLRTEEGFQR